MPNDITTPPSSLDTLARLTDIRLRVVNNERIAPEEMRDLLLDLRRDRDNTAAASRRAGRTAKKTVGTPTLTLDTLFPGS